MKRGGLKINKRGIIWETLADVFLSGMILFIGITLFFLLSGLHEEHIQGYLDDKISKLNNEEVFVSYLNAESNGRMLGDQLVISYYDGNNAALENAFDSFFEKAYSAKVCWILYKGDTKWIEKNKCSKTENLLDSTLYIPLPDNTTLKTRMEIKGYV